MTVGGLVERLPTLMAGKSAETVRKTQESLRLLEQAAGVRRLGMVNRAAVTEFRSKRLGSGVSPATVNKDLRQIKSALSYAVDAGFLVSNPLLRWKGLMLSEPEKQARVVEADEFAKLLAACENPSFAALLVVAYRQGLRRKELVNLRWSAVDLKKEVLHVVNVAKAGMAHCTLHDLRRSFSTIAQRAGVDKYTVKDLGGWSVVSVVEKHYTGDVSIAHRKAMARIANSA